jgi:transposase
MGSAPEFTPGPESVLLSYMGEKSYRPWTPTQSYLLPPSPMEWLPEKHLAFFMLDVVGELDLGQIEEAIQQKDARGERPYAPGMMTALLLYGYCVGEYSSRRIARGTYEDVAFRVICAGEHPHFTTINQFRLDHGESLGGLFVEVLLLCQRAGLVKMGCVALDGTKIKAAASKHKAMSYKRMNKDEARLRAEVEEMLRRAEQTDKEEDQLYGVGKDEEGLPGELARREERVKRIRAAKGELEKEAAEGRTAELLEQAKRQRAKVDDVLLPNHERKRARTRAKKAEQKAAASAPERKENRDAGEADQKELPLHRVASEVDGRPKPAAQRNFTDPESCIMVKDGTYIQAYNAQIIVDEAYQVIVAHGVSNQSPDQQYLVPMVERMLDSGAQVPEALLADSGYFSKDNVEHLQKRCVDPYISVGREGSDAARSSEVSTTAQSVRASMREKLSKGQGKIVYSRRKVIVEPVFGQIEEARGFRRFSQRGQTKVRREWALVCLTHNLLKLFRHVVRGSPAAAAPAL